MSLLQFWGKAQPRSPESGPQSHPLAYHCLDVAAVGDALMRYSTLDFEGTLTVREPSVLISRIAQGFGSAKAYGYGLLLMRRSAR